MQAFLKTDNRFKSDAHRAAKEFGVTIKHLSYESFSCYGSKQGMVTIHRTTDGRNLVCSFNRHWISCALLTDEEFDYDWSADESRMIVSICDNAEIQKPWSLRPREDHLDYQF